MQVSVHIDRQAAIRAGNNIEGKHSVDVDPGKLTPAQREELAAFRQQDLSVAGATEIEVIAALDLSLAEKAQAKADEKAEAEKIVAELLATDPAAYDGYDITTNVRLWDEATKTRILDPRLTEWWAAVKLERVKRAEVEKAEKKMREEARIERVQKEKKEREQKRLNLQNWAEKHGSELLRARIEEQMNWINLAHQEYALDIAPDGFGVAEKEWDHDDYRENATLDEIEELRSVRKLLAGKKARTYLHWCRMDEEDEYGDTEEDAGDPLSVLRITVLCPDGEEKEVERVIG